VRFEDGLAVRRRNVAQREAYGKSPAWLAASAGATEIVEILHKVRSSHAPLTLLSRSSHAPLTLLILCLLSARPAPPCAQAGAEHESN
jgi:hypothetical protein